MLHGRPGASRAKWGSTWSEEGRPWEVNFAYFKRHFVQERINSIKVILRKSRTWTIRLKCKRTLKYRLPGLFQWKFSFQRENLSSTLFDRWSTKFTSHSISVDFQSLNEQLSTHFKAFRLRAALHKLYRTILVLIKIPKSFRHHPFLLSSSHPCFRRRIFASLLPLRSERLRSQINKLHLQTTPV